MTPDSAKGTPNSVASRGMAFNRKNMTTKVGAAHISEMIETVITFTAASQAAGRQQQAERKTDDEGDGGDLEVDHHAGQELRQEVTQKVHQPAHAAACRCSRICLSLPHSQTTTSTTAV